MVQEVQKKPKSVNFRNSNSPLPANKRKRNNHSSPKTRVADETPCPIHPGASHTWGECFLNARNKKNSSNKGNRAPPKRAKPAGGAGHTSSSAETFAVCTEVEKQVEDLTEEVEATTEDIINDDVINGEFQVQTFQSFNNDIFQSLTMDSSEFTKPQGTLMDDYLIQCYLAHDTIHALGENNVHINTHSSNGFYNNNCLNHSFITNSSNDLPLSLHPVGMMLVCFIQNRPSRRPLKVLFDPGSDLTFIHQRVLP